MRRSGRSYEQETRTVDDISGLLSLKLGREDVHDEKDLPQIFPLC